MLSILIPAYEFAFGVRRILDSLSLSNHQNLEIIISDDSASGEVEGVWLQHPLKDRVLYRRNSPKLGAIRNWNSLLRQASGEYLLLLHHDEWPLHSDFARLVIETLRSNRPDLAYLALYKLTSDGRAARPHMPQFIKSLVLSHCPSYLYRRNVIGAPSCIIVKRDLSLQFNENLTWLVDAHWYNRLLAQRPRIIGIADAVMMSALHADSISASLGDEKKPVARKEAAQLLRDGKRLVVLRLIAGDGNWAKLMAAVESCLWGVVKAGTYIWSVAALAQVDPCATLSPRRGK